MHRAFVRQAGVFSPRRWLDSRLAAGWRFAPGWPAEPPHSPDARQQIYDVCEGFLCPSLATMNEYCDWMRAAGLTVTHACDWTDRVLQTWEICLRRDPSRGDAALGAARRPQRPTVRRSLRNHLERLPQRCACATGRSSPRCPASLRNCRPDDRELRKPDDAAMHIKTPLIQWWESRPELRPTRCSCAYRLAARPVPLGDSASFDRLWRGQPAWRSTRCWLSNLSSRIACCFIRRVRRRIERVVPSAFYGCLFCAVTCLGLLAAILFWRTDPQSFGNSPGSGGFARGHRVRRHVGCFVSQPRAEWPRLSDRA